VPIPPLHKYLNVSCHFIETLNSTNILFINGTI
jgi:hypothetical protein